MAEVDPVFNNPKTRAIQALKAIEDCKSLDELKSVHARCENLTSETCMHEWLAETDIGLEITSAIGEKRRQLTCQN